MDKAHLSHELISVFDEVINTVDKITDPVFNEVPFDGSWTIGQVTEHIVICSRGIPDSDVKDANRGYNANLADLKSIFQDMEQKSQAAEAVTPQLPPHNKTHLLDELKTNKTLLAKTINEKDLSSLCLDMEFPYIGYLTRYEWLFFIQVHTQRHLNQVKNIYQYLSDNNKL